jgi:ribosomal protein S18 acetylase RimI-like enzyme
LSDAPPSAAQPSAAQPFAVRPATRADALAIATVHVRSWQAASRGLLPQSYLAELDPRNRLGGWESFLDATAWPSTGALVLAEGDGPTIAGFAGISPTRDADADPRTVGELQTLYLDPGAWRRGGGSTLLDAARDQLRRAGFQEASAWVLETNVRARTFYERHHWRHDGSSKLHDWGTFVVTDVRYRVPLTP